MSCCRVPLLVCNQRPALSRPVTPGAQLDSVCLCQQHAGLHVRPALLRHCSGNDMGLAFANRILREHVLVMILPPCASSAHTSCQACTAPTAASATASGRPLLTLVLCQQQADRVCVAQQGVLLRDTHPACRVAADVAAHQLLQALLPAGPQNLRQAGQQTHLLPCHANSGVQQDPWPLPALDQQYDERLGHSERHPLPLCGTCACNWRRPQVRKLVLSCAGRSLCPAELWPLPLLALHAGLAWALPHPWRPGPLLYPNCDVDAAAS